MNKKINKIISILMLIFIFNHNIIAMEEENLNQIDVVQKHFSQKEKNQKSKTLRCCCFFLGILSVIAGVQQAYKQIKLNRTLKEQTKQKPSKQDLIYSEMSLPFYHDLQIQSLKGLIRCQPYPIPSCNPNDFISCYQNLFEHNQHLYLCLKNDTPCPIKIYRLFNAHPVLETSENLDPEDILLINITDKDHQLTEDSHTNYYLFADGQDRLLGGLKNLDSDDISLGSFEIIKAEDI